MDDTSQSMKELFHRKLMELSGEERVAMGARMFESARALVVASFPDRFSPAERLYNIFLRFYGRDIDPAIHERIKHRIFDSTQRTV